MRATRPRPRFTDDKALSGIILRMIASNSLVAFNNDVGRTSGVGGIGGVSPVRGERPARPAEAAAPIGRSLDAVPTQPGTPLPRGSLLDLRV